ncbi:nonsense-mediated mRNA decay protein 3 [Spathaspora passalidarum NRRL Y-27907]|uniref:60S ribosomal export protein NMD3 n=1 Tax=Spathaspora passalidarum (strain NRRL Y-27907 / 11-Y1) TaxID=619300 RepID=G3AHF6_SPAPN|nr:nonsense-mediated mRNA decay protein 3 [Spathaspora passalidarum NRRL Y-27907]EGW34120.1 nonsense-mediated mRNA decay protein 3 [Spathaspora passalidarum NRRL Y-27907]
MSNYTHMDPNHNHGAGPVATVLCCNCGVPMDGSQGLVMCYDCIKLTVDITEGIPREANVSFCRNCERFLQPPGQWIRAELESRELLALCLRRLKGLNKVRLVDASFIWTEPHSRRIRVKLTVQGEAMANTIVQQTFEVEYVVIAMQCPDCAKSYTTNTWRAAVQIRQKVPHKRTFLYLEQLILKHNAHVDTISIQESKDGLDFFYSQKNHAAKMLDFLSAVAPVKAKKSEELVSTDIHSGSSQYKFSFSVEIAPICRDDLVVLPKKLAHSLGNISRLVLCSKVTNSIQFIDPNTLQIADLSPSIYYRSPFPSLLDATQLVEFIVLDVEPTGDIRGKHVLADIEVSRAADMGVNDQSFYVRTHLGGILHPGDSCMGYYLTNTNFNSDLWDTLDSDNIPEVVIVKKHYARKNKKNKYRKWKLKRMAREHQDIVANDDSRQAKQEQERAERDYELFLQELEEDEELRQTINLYKAGENAPVKSHGDDEDEEDEDAPEIGIDELLDELDDMTLEDTPMEE